MTYNERYANILNEIHRNQKICMYDVSLAGEGFNGVSSGLLLFSFLYECIKNDTFHPYLINNMVGISVGSLTMDLMIKTMYIHNKYGKQPSLEFIESICELMRYDILSKIVGHTGKDHLTYLSILPSWIQNPIYCMYNYMTIGALFRRDKMADLLLYPENTLKVPEKNVFQNESYYNFLEIKMQKMYIMCYSVGSSILNVYTGGKGAYKDTAFVKHYVLNRFNYQSVLRASSAIPLWYMPEMLNNTDYCTDGALISTNVNHVLYTIIKNSLYFNINDLMSDVIEFIGKDHMKDGFLFFTDNLFLQKSFEEIDTYKISHNKYTMSLNLIASIPLRIYNMSFLNGNLQHMILNQPVYKEMSYNNINDIIDSGAKNAINIINHPSNIEKIEKVTIQQNTYATEHIIDLKDVIFHSPYTTMINNISNIPYEVKPGERIRLRFISTATWIRDLTQSPGLKYYTNCIIGNYNDPDIIRKSRINHRMGILNGHSTYMFYKERMQKSNDTIFQEARKSIEEYVS